MTGVMRVIVHLGGVTPAMTRSERQILAIPSLQSIAKSPCRLLNHHKASMSPILGAVLDPDAEILSHLLNHIPSLFPGDG